MTTLAFTPGNPEDVEEHRVTTMAEAMSLAKERIRSIDDPDPDPYGFVQELEESHNLDILESQWRSKPNDELWVKRVRSRGRKATVARLFIQGFTPAQIADQVGVSQVTVYNDLSRIGQEWRHTYIADIETLAAKDLATMDWLMQKLVPGIERGDTKSIAQALEIIKHRGDILGTKQGVQVDIEQMVREVAESAGYDPDKAVQLAQKISITMR